MTSAKEQMYVTEFQRRRHAYWRIAVPSLFLVVVAVGLLVAKFSVPIWVSGSLFGLGLIGHSLSMSISKCTRCPRCDSRALSGEGWFPSPTKCHMCKLNLSPRKS